MIRTKDYEKRKSCYSCEQVANFVFSRERKLIRHPGFGEVCSGCITDCLYLLEGIGVLTPIPTHEFGDSMNFTEFDVYDWVACV